MSDETNTCGVCSCCCCQTPYKCKYYITSLVFMLGCEKIKFNHMNVISIEYMNDYEFNIMPILKLCIRMDIRQKLWILKNKSDITVKFQLDRKGIDVDELEEVTCQKTIWNETFNCYFNDADDAIDASIIDDLICSTEDSCPCCATNDINTENYFTSENLFDIYLFNPNMMTPSRTNVNKVYTSDILQNIITSVLVDSGHTNVLMSPIENVDTYDEMVIPPLNAYQALMYLDEYYGLYSKGAMIYYDIDILYILDLSGKVTAKQEEEYTNTTILITPIEDAIPSNSMKIIGCNKINYATIHEGNIVIESKSASNNEVNGCINTMVETDSVEITSYSSDQSVTSSDNETIMYISSDNKYFGEIVKSRKEEAEIVVKITAENLDIKAFAPNKEYKLIYDDQTKQCEYGAETYRLAYAHHMIKMESETYMTSAHNIVLKKIST